MDKTLEDRFNDEINDLKSRYGVGLDDLTPSEVIGLVKACERVVHPFGEGNLALLDLPVTLSCGVSLHRLTIGAELWLEDFASKWWKGKMLSYAIIYALAHSRNCADFSFIKDVAFERVRGFVTRLSATDSELERAMDILHPSEDRQDNDEEQTEGSGTVDVADIVNTLEVSTGIKADVWLWGRSLNRTVNEYVKCLHLCSIKGGGVTERMKDDLDLALTALAKVKKSIYLRLKGLNNGKK